MALSSAIVREAANLFIADITSTADADVGPIVIAHGLGSIPLQATLMPIQVEVYTGSPIVTTLDIDNVEITFANAVGSGVAGAQVRVFVRTDPLRTR